MSKTFEQGKDEIARLCKYFAANRESFLAPGIKEAHVRLHLIDPFFECLGWDVRNTAMIAPQYREVVTEDSLEIEGARKAPDYSFRVGTLSKYFGEAKKCGININADPLPAYQLRRYGWSAKVPLSILTDFEEFGVYDCSSRPKPADKAGFGRLNYFNFAEYPDRWRELWDIFSRQAVWDGAFDQYAASRRKRGTTEVDGEFLKEIEGWRDALAHNIALRNRFLAPDDLNSAVQRTIDRLIFLRMAEDRGSEPYGQLLKLCEQPDIYKRFVGKLCKSADEKYNSGLFHFQKEEGIAEAPDFISAKLQVDDKVFKPILQCLYFEHGSPYHFGVLPVELLGTVYERFLGKVIRLTPEHRAKVEEKPEVRKAGGVYYTPAYIVDYIVKNTVGKMIEGKSPAQLAKFREGQPLRVLDMACGSGSFLLGAFQCLLDHSLKWYTGNNPDKFKKEVYKTTKDEWRLTIAEKKRLLTTHIYGVDIDPQAVEVSKLSLLLKVMEGETDETVGKTRMLFHERALPNLAANIKCGNSLIGPDYFSGRLIPDPEEMKRVNPFDWNREFPEAMKSGGFDCVIGNPPYGAELFSSELEYLRNKFEATTKELDTYTLFIEQSINNTKSNGLLSMIVPTGWYSGPKFSKLRILFARQTNPQVFVNLPYDIFEAWVDTTVFVTEKRIEQTQWPRSDQYPVRIITFPKRHNISSHTEFEDHTKTAFFATWFLEGGNEYLTYADKTATTIISKIVSQGIPLGEMADIQRGVTPFNLSSKSIHPNCKPAFNGIVRRYLFMRGEKSFIRFDNTLAEPKPEKYFKGPRILLRELISRQFQLQAVLVEENFITNKSMQSILPLPNGPDLKYLLGIINSQLMSWYFLRRSNVAQRDDFPKIVLRETRNLPIHSINSANHSQKLLCDKIIKLVSPMLELNSKLSQSKAEHEKNLIQRQIKALDNEIDKLVYELYGLTEEEIKIVEDGLAK